MAIPSLVPGQRVRHLKTDNLYVIESTQHLHKEQSRWVPSVVYHRLNDTDGITFSRPTSTFNSEFENA